MTQHLRLIAAILCLVPCIAHAEIQTTQDKNRMRAIELTKQLEECLVYLNSEICPFEAIPSLQQEIAELRKELHALPIQLSDAQKEYYRIQVQLNFARYELSQLDHVKTKKNIIDGRKNNIRVLIRRLAHARKRLIAECPVIDGRIVVPIDLNKAEITRSTIQRLTEEQNKLQMELKLATEMGRARDVYLLRSELIKIEAQIAGKPFTTPSQTHTPQPDIQQQALQVAARSLAQVAQSHPSRLGDLLIQERDKIQQIETELANLRPEQIPTLVKDLDNIQSRLRQEKASAVADTTTFINDLFSPSAHSSPAPTDSTTTSCMAITDIDEVCGELTLPQVPQSSPTNLANDPDDDLAKAIAISLKESHATAVAPKPDNHKPASATATATSSAEADVKTRAPEPSAALQSAIPARPTNGTMVISNASLDDSQDSKLERALQESIRQALRTAEVGRKEAVAAHNSLIATQARQPTAEVFEPALEFAIAMSLKENFKRSEPPDQQPSVPAPVNVSISVDLDEVPAMFGARNPREISRPLNHLRKPAFKGRKKLTEAERLILIHELKGDKESADAFRLSIGKAAKHTI